MAYIKSQLENIMSSNFHKTKNIIELYKFAADPQYRQIIKEFASKHIASYSHKIIKNMLIIYGKNDTDIEYCVYKRKAVKQNLMLISPMAYYAQSKLKKVLLIAHTLNLPYPVGILNCLEMLLILLTNQKQRHIQKDVAFIISAVLNKIDKSSPIYSAIVEISCKCAWACKQTINK
jgi:hypothetical protein